MKGEPQRLPPRERLIAALLWHGTWAACLLIAGGMAWQAVAHAAADGAHGWAGHGARLVEAGVALFVLLPICRVVLMLTTFLRERD